MAIRRTQYAQHNTQYLKNKRILITAGPTWVAIDSVRVISNIATGVTGLLLAKKLQRLGAKVTLLLGPVNGCCFHKNIRLIKFRLFDELRNIVKKELESKQYDIIIHSAAVADFKPKRFEKGKIDSRKSHSLKLVPLPKIIQDIKQFAPQSKLIMFKLESGVSKENLIKRAKVAQAKLNADVIVATMLNPYSAFIINRAGKIISARNRSELVNKLLKVIHLTSIT